MNNIIIPLAGPDIIDSRNKIKIYNKFNDGYLLKEVINSRDWAQINESNFYFVFQDNSRLREAYFNDIQHWFGFTRAIFLTELTDGAALSCAAAISLIEDHSLPLIIDLGDIYFESDLKPKVIFDAQPSVDSIVLTHESDNPSYSYVNFSEHEFVEAREKLVISGDASVGVYIFRNTSAFLNALAWFISEGQTYKFNDLYYCAPLLNGVRFAKKRVVKHQVANVIDPKVKGG